MKKIILNLLMAVMVFGATAVYAESDEATVSSRDVVCAQDAKLCSNGSYVGRKGPNCEFTKCPDPERVTKNIIQRVKAVFERKKEVEEKRDEIKNKVENRIASSTEKIKEREKAQKEEMKRFEKISQKYLRAIEKEEAVLARIVTRIEKIKLIGGNTSEAERYVSEAELKLTEARASYEALKTMAISADSFEKVSRELLDSIKSTAKTIEVKLREAHKLLQKTVGSLRGLSQLRNATSTREV